MEPPHILSNTTTYQIEGEFSVQLEVPDTSTLTAEEIQTILSAASWETRPDEIADGYHTGRGIVFDRDESIYKNGVALGSLDISGIGVISEPMDGRRYEAMQPPSADNFLDTINTQWGGYVYAKNRTIVEDRAAYSPLGTYVADELATKVKNTNTVAQLELEQLAVPHVEAYGWYLDEELSNADGPFGFFVMPVPNSSIQRADSSLRQRIADEVPADLIKRSSQNAAAPVYRQLLQELYTPLIPGLRELHDTGYAHLQPHFGNFYLHDSVPYLVDWTTLHPLQDDAIDNRLNRALDIVKPLDILTQGIHEKYPEYSSEKLTSDVLIPAVQQFMHQYVGDASADYMATWSQFFSATEGLSQPQNINLSLLSVWMRDYGIEEIAEETAYSDTVPKVGRNDPCPCESGKKYKRCHGGRS